MRLPWLAHDEAPGPYITIPQYWFNKTKQHTHPSVSPPRTHHIHHDIHDTFICQIFDSQNVNLSNLQHFCVWKHAFWVDEILENLIQNSIKHALRCATTSQIFFATDAAKKKTLAASRGDQAHKLFLVLFPVSQRTPLREQAVSCFCFRSPYGKTNRWSD